MKVTRSYTLDMEVAERFEKERDKSATVNRLIAQHLDMRQKLTKDEIKRRIAILEAEKAHEAKIKEINGAKQG
jgi:hypothetical protein